MPQPRWLHDKRDRSHALGEGGGPSRQAPSPANPRAHRSWPVDSDTPSSAMRACSSAEVPVLRPYQNAFSREVSTVSPPRSRSLVPGNDRGAASAGAEMKAALSTANTTRMVDIAAFRHRRIDDEAATSGRSRSVDLRYVT